jgi:hypothetical protein
MFINEYNYLTTMGKLRQYIINNIPTDIEIILSNPHDTIKIQTH